MTIQLARAADVVRNRNAWIEQLSQLHEQECAELRRQLADADARAIAWAERCGRLESELAAATTGAVKAGAEIARLCARLAALEAELNADPCADCDDNCGECRGEVV